VLEAMKPGAPLLTSISTRCTSPAADKPSNVARRLEFARGDVKAGFAQADVIVEREFNTSRCTRLHRTAALPRELHRGRSGRSLDFDPGQFVFRAQCAKLLQMEVSKIRVMPTEIRRGFGGKNTV